MLEEVRLARVLFIIYGPLEICFEELKRLLDTVHILEIASGMRKRRSLALDTGGSEILHFVQDSDPSC